jgi:predicted RNase H-like HicB family nuclease
MLGARNARMVPIMVKLGDQYVGFIKGLPGCAAVGETLEECEDELATNFVTRIEAEEAMARGGVFAQEH